MVVRGSAWGGGFLDITERDPCVQGRGDEGVPQCVRPDRFGDPAVAGDAAHDPPGTMPVQAVAIGGQEDWSFAALTDGQVDRPGCPLGRAGW
jgi:hypothetical protein